MKVCVFAVLAEAVKKNQHTFYQINTKIDAILFADLILPARLQQAELAKEKATSVEEE